MKAIEKINLVRNIDDSLNAKYSDYNEKLFILEHHKIILHYHADSFGNEEAVDFKNSLLNANEKNLQQIAEELEISTNLSQLIKRYPKNWINNNDIKLFISHSSKNKSSANKLKNALQPYKISCFVAHQDVYPSLEWEAEIVNALNTMDCFISLHNDDFEKSQWCQQESGFALARSVEFIPIRFPNDPQGFVKKIQALPAMEIAETTKRIIEAIKESKKIGELYSQINPVNNASDDDDEIPF